MNLAEWSLIITDGFIIGWVASWTVRDVLFNKVKDNGDENNSPSINPP